MRHIQRRQFWPKRRHQKKLRRHQRWRPPETTTTANEDMATTANDNMDFQVVSRKRPKTVTASPTKTTEEAQKKAKKVDKYRLTKLKKDLVPIIYKKKSIYVDGVLRPNTKAKLYKDLGEVPLTYGEIPQKLYHEMREGHSNDIMRLGELARLIDQSIQTNEAEWNETGDPIPTVLRLISLERF